MRETRGAALAAGATLALALGLAALGVLPALELGAGGAAAWGCACVVVLMSVAAVALGARGELESSQGYEASLAQLRERTSAALARARQNRREAEDAQRYREEFLAAVSHELRTPLNAILGFSEVLLQEMDGALSDAQREDVEAIRQAGHHLKSLIDEVLDASARRITEDNIELIDVAAIAREVARIVKGSRRRRESVEVVVDAEDVPRIHADSRRIRQILLNLGSNGIKYTERGEVRFVVRAEPGALRVEVRDTGRGISPEDLARVFRAYERVDSQRGRTEGWGLGLAIADEMARWHGGRIEVESEVGRGSVFTLVLPAGGGSVRP